MRFLGVVRQHIVDIEGAPLDCQLLVFLEMAARGIYIYIYIYIYNIYIYYLYIYIHTSLILRVLLLIVNFLSSWRWLLEVHLYI